MLAAAVFLAVFVVLGLGLGAAFVLIRNPGLSQRARYLEIRNRRLWALIQAVYADACRYQDNEVAQLIQGEIESAVGTVEMEKGKLNSGGHD